MKIMTNNNLLILNRFHFFILLIRLSVYLCMFKYSDDMFCVPIKKYEGAISCFSWF